MLHSPPKADRVGPLAHPRHMALASTTTQPTLRTCAPAPHLRSNNGVRTNLGCHVVLTNPGLLDRPTALPSCWLSRAAPCPYHPRAHPVRHRSPPTVCLCCVLHSSAYARVTTRADVPNVHNTTAHRLLPHR
jgi:hypothetical protein